MLVVHSWSSPAATHDSPPGCAVTVYASTDHDTDAEPAPAVAVTSTGVISAATCPRSSAFSCRRHFASSLPDSNQKSQIPRRFVGKILVSDQHRVQRQRQRGASRGAARSVHACGGRARANSAAQ